VTRAADLRWGSHAPKGTDAARDRLLDSAAACFERVGVLKTTVEDVATHACVSRATVYRYFGGRDELILGVLLRELSRLNGRIEEVIRAQPTIEDAIVESILASMDQIRADENLALLVAPESAGQTSAVAGRSEALFARHEAFLGPLLQQAAESGVLRRRLDVKAAAEFVLRSVISLLTMSGGRQRSRDEEREFIRSFVARPLLR
jgi:AcrR family transcriptional regulator